MKCMGVYRLSATLYHTKTFIDGFCVWYGVESKTNSQHKKMFVEALLDICLYNVGI